MLHPNEVRFTFKNGMNEALDLLNEAMKLGKPHVEALREQVQRQNNLPELSDEVKEMLKNYASTLSS